MIITPAHTFDHDVVDLAMVGISPQVHDATTTAPAIASSLEGLDTSQGKDTGSEEVVGDTWSREVHDITHELQPFSSCMAFLSSPRWRHHVDHQVGSKFLRILASPKVFVLKQDVGLNNASSLHLL